MQENSILIIDDEPTVRHAIGERLKVPIVGGGFAGYFSRST